jgi:hypothetical protein
VVVWFLLAKREPYRELDVGPFELMEEVSGRGGCRVTMVTMVIIAVIVVKMMRW